MTSTTPIQVELLGGQAARNEIQRFIGTTAKVQWLQESRALKKALLAQQRDQGAFDALKRSMMLDLDAQRPPAFLGPAAEVGRMLRESNFLGKTGESQRLVSEQITQMMRPTLDAIDALKTLGQVESPAARLGRLLREEADRAARESTQAQGAPAIFHMPAEAPAEAPQQPRPATNIAELAILFWVVYPLAALILEQANRERLKVTAATAVAMALYVVLREVGRRRG